jgi:hypothetical protein
MPHLSESLFILWDSRIWATKKSGFWFENMTSGNPWGATSTRDQSIHFRTFCSSNYLRMNGWRLWIRFRTESWPRLALEKPKWSIKIKMKIPFQWTMKGVQCSKVRHTWNSERYDSWKICGLIQRRLCTYITYKWSHFQYMYVWSAELLHHWSLYMNMKKW